LNQAFKNKTSQAEKVLILGYGGGSAASIIHKKYNPKASIVAVEIDPEV